eukprot:2465697-Lingulodinium_polyedra.AAC.1
MPHAGGGSPAGAGLEGQGTLLEGPGAVQGAGPDLGRQDGLQGSPGTSGVDHVSPHTVQTSRQVSTDRVLSYAEAGHRLHHMFGHSGQAAMFAWKL